MSKLSLKYVANVQIEDKGALVQVIGLATSHYLIQCVLKRMTTCDLIRIQQLHDFEYMYYVIRQDFA